MFPKEVRSAVFSDDRIYRYTLNIVWDTALPKCQFIGLNPSTADEIDDDNTVRRCKSFARREGCGTLIMTNVFAYRDTDPKGMMNHPKPIGEIIRLPFTDPEAIQYELGERNDQMLKIVASQCALTIAAWGVFATHMDRGRAVAKLIPNLMCLGKTKDGHPKHPLYLPSDAELIPFSYPS